MPSRFDFLKGIPKCFKTASSKEKSLIIKARQYGLDVHVMRFLMSISIRPFPFYHLLKQQYFSEIHWVLE